MPIIFLTLNSVGLGHLVRTTRIAEAYSALGYGVTVVAQGTHAALGAPLFPGKTVPQLNIASPAVRRRVASELSSLAEMAEPRVVFEDTHPSGLALSPRIRRVLIVRPTAFAFMKFLNRNERGRYHTFLIADAPDSPTWPYTDEETREILSWSNWLVMGPVFHRASETEIARARARYRVRPEEPICVVCMGGGGVQAGAAADISRFVAAAKALTAGLRRVDPRTRVLYVRGPLTPPEFVVPAEFEPVIDEINLPALFALARGAIVRPGNNTVWECIGAGIPFVSVRGTTYQEPVTERLRRLEPFGFAVTDLAAEWTNAGTERAQRRAETARRWSGRPDPSLLMHVVAAPRAAKTFPAVTATARRTGGGTGSLQVIARIDDVIELDENLRWLVRLLAAHGLRSSLEVIPAQCRMVDADLAVVDPERLVTVGQHGYDHVPNYYPRGRTSEFPFTVEASARDRAKLRDGNSELKRRFPTRLTGGVSAPFDMCPSWLGRVWRELGGSHLSCRQVVPSEPALPVLRYSVDLWDWAGDRAIGVASVLAQVRLANALRGYAGIVIHPWLLERDGEAMRLVELLQALSAMGIHSPRERALLAPAVA
jgi:hypothetical protein